VLEQADVDLTDVVKVTQYLTRAEDIAAYAEVRTHFLGDAEPASMLLVVPQLVRPEFWSRMRPYNSSRDGRQRLPFSRWEDYV
jgi:enamine deaminase RidA (YjgF/YER057c/UK114 family)